MSELLPCPFCGSAESTPGFFEERSYICCDGCEASGPWVIADNSSPAGGEAWNRRAAVQADYPEAVGLTDNDLERIFEDAGGKWNGDMWTIEDADFHPAMRSLLASAPTEPMSAPTAEPVATLWVQMETHDMGQSLAPNPPFKAAIAKAHTAAKDLPLGEYLLYATPPSAATPEPSDAERYQLVRRGQHWSVIDGIGNVLRGDDLDTAVDAIRATKGSTP